MQLLLSVLLFLYCSLQIPSIADTLIQPTFAPVSSQEVFAHGINFDIKVETYLTEAV